MTTPEYQMDATELSRHLFFEVTETGVFGGKLRVMCNYCTKVHHLFFEGEATDLTGDDWIARAAVHIHTEHGRK